MEDNITSILQEMLLKANTGRRAAKVSAATFLEDLDRGQQADSLHVWNTAKAIGNEMGKRSVEAPDTFNYNFSFFEQLYKGYVVAQMPTVYDWVTYLLDTQGTERSYGDIDHTVKIVHQDERRRVFTIDDHCTCYHKNYWLVVQDLKNRGLAVVSLSKGRSDWKTNPYPKRLNLSFYKAIDWDITPYNAQKVKAATGVSVYTDGYEQAITIQWADGITGFTENDGHIHPNDYGDQQMFIWHIASFVSELKREQEDE